MKGFQSEISIRFKGWVVLNTVPLDDVEFDSHTQLRQMLNFVEGFIIAYFASFRTNPEYNEMRATFPLKATKEWGLSMTHGIAIAHNTRSIEDNVARYQIVELSVDESALNETRKMIQGLRIRINGLRIKMERERDNAKLAEEEKVLLQRISDYCDEFQNTRSRLFFGGGGLHLLFSWHASTSTEDGGLWSARSDDSTSPLLKCLNFLKAVLRRR